MANGGFQPERTLRGTDANVRFAIRKRTFRALLLNGKGDEFAYQYGKLAGGLPFDDLKRRAHINDAARAADQSAAFSQLIREGRPGFGLN